ncbi:hypothetical protein H6S82_23595 [Planktothrix sp. FACHB-1355]|uniref:Uncharacterized protein n=1 Tax=Aerosakkonema funiforme FACHB-1375 TaxID=2949571 RepID=A0A926VB24_9CYAN|nr:MULTISPECIES: hypothetical protein [Oscillatoriales]MBD2180523.1 hypothetical protein [Aerosakkonema funiforme FACHB-1375]MBD3561805.1 hypothetical protein [Planktothrix sp. FACHB-1355]
MDRSNSIAAIWIDASFTWEAATMTRSPKRCSMGGIPRAPNPTLTPINLIAACEATIFLSHRTSQLYSGFSL